MPETTVVTNNLYGFDGVANVEPILDDKTLATVAKITLPQSVAEVNSGSMWVQDTTEIWAKHLYKEDIKNVFRAEATNGIIVTKEAQTKLEDVADLEYTDPVADFAIFSTQDGSGKIKVDGQLIYVVCEGDIADRTYEIYADNFQNATGGASVYSKEVSFETESDLFALDITADGRCKVILGDLPADKGALHSGEIAVTAKAGGVEKIYTVQIVRVTTAEFAIGSSITADLGFGETIEKDLQYRTTDTFELKVTPRYNTFDGNPIEGISCSVEPIYTVGDGDVYTVDNGTDKLTLSKYEGTQTLTIKIGEYIEESITLTVLDYSFVPFVTVFENTNTYMYKVGNANAITLSQLFKTQKAFRDVKLTIYDAFWTNGKGERQEINKISGDFDATYTQDLTASDWATSEIKFSRTGVAIIRIEADGENSYTDLAVEVVDGYNVTDYSEIKNTYNSVLLCDLENATTQAVVGNYTLYGNGFTITAPNYVASKGLISVANGTVDNLQLIGPIYPTVVWGSEPYWAGGIYTTGNATITNSYLYGFRAPLHMNGGTLTVSDTVLRNGTACSLYTQGGTKITLTNVTTMQSIVNPTLDNPNTTDVDERNNQVLGAGVLCWVCTPDIEINGYFNQYNWVKEADLQYLPKYLKEIPIIGSIDVIEIAFEMLFGSGEDYEPYKHTVDGTVYVNAGIVWYHNKCDTVTDNRSSAEKASKPYKNLGIGVSLLGIGVEGTVYGRTNNPVVTKSEMTLPSDYEYKPTKQGVTRPAFTFVNGSLATSKPSGVDEYAYYASNVVNVGVKHGTTYTLSNLDGLFQATKHGRDLVISKITYTTGGVTADVTDNNSLTFDKVSSGYLTYTIVDNQLYDLDGLANDQENVTEHVVTVKSTMTNLTNATFAGAENCATSWKQSGFISKKYAMQVALTNLTIKDYDEYGNAKTITIDSTSVSGFSVSAKVGGSAKAVELVKDGSTIYLRWTDGVDSKTATTMTVTFKYKGLNGNTVTVNQDYTI